MAIKDIFKKAKDKVNSVIEKGNSSLAKFNNTKFVKLYSMPIIGGFVCKRAFYEGDKLLFPTKSFIKEEVKVNTIIGLNEDSEYYVITKVNPEVVNKTIIDDDKEYTYECYEAEYGILNNVFTNEVDGLPFYDLTKEQEETLNEIRTLIESKQIIVKAKKDFCLNLWQYFTECIQYRLKNHYIMITFTKIASEYIEDFSTYLLRLF